MPLNNHKIACFGEALWDVFPDKRKPGGAPMNVAMRIASLGGDVSLISRVGKDREGADLVDFIATSGAHTNMIQLDSEHPTGRVVVDLSNPSEVRYTIEQPAAWDFIEPAPITSLDMAIFGSLAARNVVSRTSLLELLESASIRVFDMNLRPPFDNFAVVSQLLEQANWLKINEHELAWLCNQTRFKGDLSASVRMLAERWVLSTICVTLGSEGACLFHEGQIVTQPAFKVQIADTVGAGDSFLATWLYYMLEGMDPQLALARGCAMGALVASREGANPKVESGEIEAILATAV